MAVDWSLEKELCKLAGVEDFYDALRTLHIITEKCWPLNVVKSDSWERGSAETYIYKFWIQESEKQLTGYVIKACVAFSPASSLEAILNEWVERRRLVEANGVDTPRLYTYGHGVILEELIPHELKSRVIEASDPTVLLKQVAVVVGTLLKLGFNSINVLDDLRTRGTDVVMIDFGEDLGPPNVYSKHIDYAIEDFLTKVREWGVKLSNTLIEDIKSTVLLVSDSEAEKKYVM